MDKSERFWDRAAATYDQEEKKGEQTYKKIIQKTKMYIDAGDTVLDYGCGTGITNIGIAGSVKEIQAIDISSKMIDHAKRKTAKYKIENIYHLQTTIFDERFEKESFDVVTAFTVLHLLEDIPRDIKRIHELLKPEGLFISSTPCIGEKIFTYILLSLVSKFGLVPEIKPLKFLELKNIISEGGFSILESECLDKKTQQYLFIAKKNNSPL